MSNNGTSVEIFGNATHSTQPGTNSDSVRMERKASPVHTSPLRLNDIRGRATKEEVDDAVLALKQHFLQGGVKLNLRKVRNELSVAV